MNKLKIKENAKNDYLEIIKQSWTFKSFTEKEKSNLLDVFQETELKGSYDSRIEQLYNMYYAFLKALDYDPINWR